MYFFLVKNKDKKKLDKITKHKKIFLQQSSSFLKKNFIFDLFLLRGLIISVFFI